MKLEIFIFSSIKTACVEKFQSDIFTLRAKIIVTRQVNIPSKFAFCVNNGNSNAATESIFTQDPGQLRAKISVRRGPAAPAPAPATPAATTAPAKSHEETIALSILAEMRSNEESVASQEKEAREGRKRGGRGGRRRGGGARV